MLDLMNEIFTGLGNFLKKYIYPFATPFFAILNYLKMKELLLKNGQKNWANVFLVVSVIYFLFAFGFGIYYLINNINSGPS